MYTLLDASKDFENLDETAKENASKLVASIPSVEQAATYPAGTDFSKIAINGNFFMLRDGQLAFKRSGRTLFFLNEGDLIGLESFFIPEQAEISSEFGVVVDLYKVSDLVDAAGRDLSVSKAISTYLTARYRQLLETTSLLMRGEIDLSPEVRHYRCGDVLIEQGAKADLVYTLIEGRAEAFVDGIKVGEIGPDQVFGMLAVLTQTPRTATVRAVSNCMAIAIAPEHFMELVQHKPQTVIKLIEDMAKTIVCLNSQVVGLSKNLY